MTSSVFEAGCMNGVLETGNVNKIFWGNLLKKMQSEKPIHIGKDNSNMSHRDIGR